ncbi:MAG: hypothetical protein JWP31_576, partial [Aeromicrobium sp.]|nr:hypothetical protein [Aeromicrobium sp.]
RVDATDAFIGPLFADLQEVGAVVTSGNASVPEQSVASRETEPADDMSRETEPADEPSRETEPADEPSRETEPADEPSVEVAMADRELAESQAVERLAAHELPKPVEPAVPVFPIDPGSPVSHYLADLRNAVPATAAAELPDAPGLYGWFVDPIGARELNRCLMLPVRAGLVFIGQVGGSSWHSLADPVLNLRDHVTRVQLHGRARASTFRMTLATVLRDHLQMTSLEDPRLTEWMLEHLSITAWGTDDLGELRELEQVVVNELNPPLNVDHLPATEYRDRLTEMRSALG